MRLFKEIIMLLWKEGRNKGKQKEETKDSPIMKQWKELKAKHPDALLLFV